MRDIELYRHLLGLERPWSVEKVELDVKEQRVNVWVEHGEGLRWPCPSCGHEFPLYDHVEERAWRHLDSCQFYTFLHARPPRVECPEHGVLQVALPWAEPRARFTALFERLAIDVLRETSVLAATRILRITWDEAWYLMERAVRRGQLAKERKAPAHIGVDEKSFRKGQRYVTVVCDPQEGTVEHVEEGRKKESLDRYFLSLPPFVYPSFCNLLPLEELAVFTAAASGGEASGRWGSRGRRWITCGEPVEIQEPPQKPPPATLMGWDNSCSLVGAKPEGEQKCPTPSPSLPPSISSWNC